MFTQTRSHPETMKLFRAFYLRQRLIAFGKAKVKPALVAGFTALGFSLFITSHTLANERKTPLQIQIPSVPATHPSVNVVDDSLSVQLLDAQMAGAQRAHPPPVSAVSIAPPVASGQVLIGSAPATPTTTRRAQKRTSKPAVVMAGSGVSASSQALSLGAPPSYLSAAQPRRLTAVVPDPSVASPPPAMQPTANPAAMPMEAAMQASAQLLAQAAMQASAQMLTQAAAQASAQMLSQAGVQQQAQQQQAQIQAQQQQQAALQAQQAEAQRQAELQAQIQAEAEARARAEAEAQAQAELQAQQQAALEAQRQAQLRAQQQAQIAAQAAADAKAAAEAQKQAQAQAQLQAQAAAEAKARAEAEAQMAANAQAQARAAAEAAALSQSRLQAQVPTQMIPISQAAAQLQAPPSQASSMVEQFVARLPTLAEAKQSFASEEVVAENDMQDVPYLSNEEASTLAAIEPAAGGGNASIDNALKVPQPPATQPFEAPKNITELPVLASDSAPTKSLNIPSDSISHPAVKQAVEEVLSEESNRLLKRVPSHIDSPKNKDKQRVDIEREALTNSVFSELKSSQDLAEDADAVGMTIDVKRPSLDVSYELERAYNAIASGQTDIARESYIRVLASEPKNIQALFGMGALLHRAGDLNGARSYYAKVLEQDPDNRDTLNNFLSLVAEEAPEQALSKLKDLESKNPDFSPIPAQISFIYQKTKNMQLAAQYMMKALSLAPNNMTYKYNLAILLDRQGARQDAASFYQELVDAYLRGESVPGNIASIQERLTFIRSNR
jgi:Flp pilus assembly protein TadD